MPRKSTRLRTRLERERRAAKLSQADLARHARTTQATISRIEGGRLLSPSFAILDNLASALNRFGRRRVQAADLQPRPQPVLIKGVLQQPRKRGAA